MARSNSKRFFKNQWRFRRSDPNQLHLPLDEVLGVLLSGNDDEKCASFAQVRHNLERFPGAYDLATLDELKEHFAAHGKTAAYRYVVDHRNFVAHQKNEIEAKKKAKSYFVSLEGFAKIYDWVQRQGFFEARQIAEKNDPPRRAEMLLHFGLPKRDRECMIGDLEEEYRSIILPKYGPRVAARWYWWQTVRSVIAASGGRVRVWLSFGGLARAAGWIVEKFTL